MAASVLLGLILDLGPNGLVSKIRSSFLQCYFTLKTLPSFSKCSFKTDLSTPLGVGQNFKPFTRSETFAFLSLRLDKFTTFSDTKKTF